MAKTYVIDGKPVTVTWSVGEGPLVFTIHVAGTPIGGSVEKTVLGAFLARDRHRRPLGTFAGLYRAVEQVVRAEQD